MAESDSENAEPTETIASPPQTPVLLPTPLRMLNAAKPGQLWHYTDQRGFLGILETGRLWATSIRYLNDSQEYQVGLTRIAEEIKSRVGRDADVGRLLASVFDLVSWTAPTVGVVSFSEARDDLGQWRAYGGGSGGYAIGWDGPALMRQINTGLGALVKVVYGNSSNAKEHDGIVSAFCDEMISEARQVSDTPDQWQRFRFQCSTSVQVICSILKDWAFKSEFEWRGIVVAAAGDRVRLKVRQGRSTLVPYFDLIVRDDALFTNKLPITEVIVGPTPHPDLAREATVTALSINSQGTQVSNTTVPFRNW